MGSADGRKNQILMAFSTANQFHQNLTKFIEFYRGLGEVDTYNLRQGELKTEVMYKDDKKYHMDLKENARGRFLKVSETNARARFHVFIPADGMKEFKQNIGGSLRSLILAVEATITETPFPPLTVQAS